MIQIVIRINKVNKKKIQLFKLSEVLRIIVNYD